MTRALLYIIALLVGIVLMTPIGWAISTALKTRQQTFASPPRWVPTSYRIVDERGEHVPVAIINRIDGASAVVRLTSGPRAGRTIAVAASALSRTSGGQLRVQLRGPEPFTAESIEEYAEGVAQIRIPSAPATRGDRFVSTTELIELADPQFDNFERAWTALPLPFHRFVINTYTITILNIIGTTLSCSAVAYGFARFRFRGRNVLFMLLLSTTMLPAQVTMIPVFLIWKNLRLIDTFAPLTIPSFFAHSAFYVFLLRQFFMGLPRELDEAAMIDGAGPIRIWWQILMPLMKPALITVAVLTFISQWDDFIGPLIYLGRLENYTVSLALRLFQDQNGTEFNLLMAAALVHMVPVIVLFFIAQRYFVRGVAMSGLKG